MKGRITKAVDLLNLRLIVESAALNLRIHPSNTFVSITGYLSQTALWLNLLTLNVTSLTG